MVRQSLTDEQRALLSDGYNRAVLATLEDAGRPLEVDELGRRLVDRDVTVVDGDEYEAKVAQARLSLHHERLPKLAEVGLVEYDHEATVVAARSAGSPDVDRVEGATIDEVVTRLTTGDGLDEDGIGVIHGRESIVEYGRRLADEAEEELFCMYVSTDLLGEGCIRHAEGAIDRGVSMYVGSGNAEVRERTRERLPEATIWEPQLDLTNAPTYPRIGRLVLVDRRAVMLAVLEEPEPGTETPTETAVVGSGEDNPVVVLARDLLGSRLDHLDYQSEDFRNKLLS